MGCAHNKNQNGFTLVEISIVMIIIGLLIGGTFGGMKLIENMQANKTVQDLKAIESASLTFKDTFGRLPGDIVNPAARLSNCTVAPCATGGNGDRIIGLTISFDDTITATDENFVFWSHLSAADLLSLGTKNSTNLDFDEGQPSAPIGGGYRLVEYSGVVGFCGVPMRRMNIMITSESTNAPYTGNQVSCMQLSNIDRKMDDGQVNTGVFMGPWGCESDTTCNNTWVTNATGTGWYDIRGF